MKGRMWAAGGLSLLVVAAPAAAEIVPSQSGGFASSNSAVVAASPEQAWEALIHPEGWWSHTWSGDMTNLSLEAEPGGCFCEALPPTSDSAEWGAAEHMRVILVQPHAMLRMTGALGPLQSEGLSGTLTVSLSEEGDGTRIEWDYVVGGQGRMPMDQLAQAVDGVQREFLGGLVERLGGAS